MPLTEETQTTLYDHVDEARGYVQEIAYSIESEINQAVNRLDEALSELENLELGGDSNPVVLWYEENFPAGGNELNDNELAYVMGSRLVEYYLGNS